MDIFDPLTKERFEERLKINFPSVYLTTISIIQGVALGILANETYKYINEIEHWGCHFWYTLFSLLGIIIVSYEYVWFIGVFRWSPKIWDTVVPIGLGFSEVSPMFFLTKPDEWWLWNSIFCLGGGLAFVNSICNCRRKMFGDNGKNEEAFKITRNELLGNIVVSFGLSLVGFFTWAKWFWPFSLINNSDGYYWVLPFYFLLGIIILWKGERFMNNLYEALKKSPR